MTLIGILAILLMVGTISSQSYVKKASALSFGSGPCPAGKVRDWTGICFNKSEAKACPTCAPGSAAPAEKPETSSQVEANKEVEKSTTAEKPETSSQVETNRDLFHKEVEPSIKQGQQ